MSTVLAPFGLKPLYHPSGTVRPKALDVASGYNTNIFQYTPVTVVPGTSSLQAATLNANSPMIGTFLGVEFTPANGRRQYSNWWTAGTVATQVTAYYTDDPAIVYEVQADGPVAESSLGAQANLNLEVGNQTTGFSTVSLKTASLTNSAEAQVRVVGCAQGPGPVAPGNFWGDAFTIVQVQISNHLWVAQVNA